MWRAALARLCKEIEASQWTLGKGSGWATAFHYTNRKFTEGNGGLNQVWTPNMLQEKPENPETSNTSGRLPRSSVKLCEARGPHWICAGGERASPGMEKWRMPPREQTPTLIKQHLISLTGLTILAFWKPKGHHKRQDQLLENQYKPLLYPLSPGDSGIPERHLTFAGTETNYSAHRQPYPSRAASAKSAPNPSAPWLPRSYYARCAFWRA